MSNSENAKTAVRVSTVSVLVNILLSVLKLLAGIFGRSVAMISDAAHSLSDVFGSVIVIIGVKFSSKKADKEHPYGHEKMECLASLALAAILIFTGGIIAYEGLVDVITGKEKSAPEMIALIAAIISIVVKEAMFWYTYLAAKKTNISALRAEAWHHRTDAISSVGSLIGIGGAIWLKWYWLDPLMGCLIALLIFKVAYDIIREAVNKMVDRACDDETIEQMSETILGVPGVEGLDSIKTRLFGSRCYVDIEISADGDLNLWESHDIAEQVHDLIEEKFEEVKHCTVHVNPK
ncbi:MAG: cation transporter [Eubacterium sp.]|nr:cation transporter [Eubacterium sp.]